MTIDLYLCGFKGLQVLDHLCTAGYAKHIQSVIAARDINVINDYFVDIKSTSEKHGLHLNERGNDIPHTNADYRLVIGWRWMLSNMHNTIVFHDSLLPAYRGFAPLVNALINGESTIGSTALMAADDYDSGPVITSRSINITHPIRIQNAIEEISILYVQMADEIVSKLINEIILPAAPQDETKASYSLWRDEEDYMINWQDDSNKILRTIYALSYPYRGARTLLHGKQIAIQEAELFNDVTIINRDPGKVIFMSDEHPVVVCGKGLIKITAATDSHHAPILPLKKFRSRFGR